MDWANREGLAGRPLWANQAASIGSLTHNMVRDYCRGDDPAKAVEAWREQCGDAATDVAQRCFDQWLKWLLQSGLSIVAVEQQMVCDVLGLGGTIDAIMVDGDGVYEVTDWKSSKAIYKNEYEPQVAAYTYLLNHGRSNRPGVRVPGQGLAQRARIVRLDKNGEDFDPRQDMLAIDGERLADRTAQFQHALAMHRTNKKYERRRK
jgi:hypothetical protein